MGDFGFVAMEICENFTEKKLFFTGVLTWGRQGDDEVWFRYANEVRCIQNRALCVASDVESN